MLHSCNMIRWAGNCEQRLYWFSGAAVDIVTFKTASVSVFKDFSHVRQSKQIKWRVDGEVCGGWSHSVGCDTRRSCQDHEGTVGWWQGRGGQENLIPSSREDQCTVASCLGGQSHGVLQDTISPLPSHVKPHHLPLYPIHPHLHSCFDSRPKQTATCLRPQSPFPWWQRTRAQRWPWRFGSVGADKEANSETAQRFGCRQAFLLDTGPKYTGRKKNLQCAKLIASNQASDINTSCHLGETYWTKRVLVKVGWDH